MLFIPLMRLFCRFTRKGQGQEGMLEFEARKGRDGI